MQQPSVGRVVHYVSYGTPGGEYLPECRAAIVTKVSGHYGERDTTDEWLVDLCILNPEGMFFNKNVEQDQLPPADKILSGERTGHRGGTWHWPERV